MTVSWNDIPGSTLASKVDAIDFLASADVVAISVAFAGRPEERAYRDGAFLPPYAASTKLGSTFALRRSGGWPSAPTVYVDEAPAAPVMGAPWRLLYSVDLTQQGTKLMMGSGPATIDGKVWWLKGSPNSSGQGGTVQAAALTPTGLHITTNQSYGALNHFRWVLPLAQIDGYNPDAPLTVWARFAASPYVGPLIGLISTPAEAGLFGSTDPWFGVGAYAQSTSTVRSWWSMGGQAASYYDTSHTVGEPPEQMVYGFQELSMGLSRQIVGPAASVPADPMTLPQYITYAENVAKAHGVLDKATKSVWFAPMFGGGDFVSFTLKKLWIMQPMGTP